MSTTPNLRSHQIRCRLRKNKARNRAHRKKVRAFHQRLRRRQQ